MEVSKLTWVSINRKSVEHYNKPIRLITKDGTSMIITNALIQPFVKMSLAGISANYGVGWDAHIAAIVFPSPFSLWWYVPDYNG